MNADRLRVEPGARRPLDAVPTDFTNGFDDRAGGQQHLQRRLARLEALQEKLYAQRQHALLVIIQGMDTAGKDSAIKHVFTGFNPQGLSVHNFKQPSSEERAHDFLWPASTRLPLSFFLSATLLHISMLARAAERGRDRRIQPFVLRRSAGGQVAS